MEFIALGFSAVTALVSALVVGSLIARIKRLEADVDSLYYQDDTEVDENV